jgi:Putative O-methyltransferase
MPPDYRVRPAKHVERKMLVESFRRLGEFADVSTYRYVGFGAYQFQDFILVHRELGITTMSSIESNELERERIRFNRPFACVNLSWGLASEQLALLSWEARTIAWLDYTARLDREILEGLRVFASSAVSGSVIVITVNASEASDTGGRSPVKALAADIGEERVPPGLAANDVTGGALPKIYRRILTNEIETILTQRNGALVPGSRLQWRQYIFFVYRDGVRMMTLGGVLVDHGHRLAFQKTGLMELPFAREGEEPYHIRTPNLTPREIRFIDQYLPGEAGALPPTGVPEKDLQDYAEVYRWFPVFADVEL